MKYLMKVLAYITHGKDRASPIAAITKEPVSCNYTDNYYGDRHCVSK
jgi:hypothetical protein